MEQLKGTVKAICISTVRGVEKKAVSSARFIKDFGTAR